MAGGWEGEALVGTSISLTAQRGVGGRVGDEEAE